MTESKPSKDKSKKDLNTIDPVNLHHISLYEEKCVVCYHLFPSYKNAKHYYKCHYSRGNEDCPAQGLQFTLLTKSKKQKRAYNLAHALTKGDLNSGVKMLRKMLHLSEAERTEIINIMFEMSESGLDNPDKPKD